MRRHNMSHEWDLFRHLARGILREHKRTSHEWEDGHEWEDTSWVTYEIFAAWSLAGGMLHTDVGQTARQMRPVCSKKDPNTAKETKKQQKKTLWKCTHIELHTCRTNSVSKETCIQPKRPGNIKRAPPQRPEHSQKDMDIAKETCIQQKRPTKETCTQQKRPVNSKRVL